MASSVQPRGSFARARSDLYDLLAAVFDGEVTVLERAIQDDAFPRLATVLPGEFDTGPLERRDLDTEALRVGYDNLFVVPGPHYVPPFASAHVDDPSEDFESDSPYHDAGTAGELFGDPARTVADHYDRAGFRPERGDGIPDHVAAEFEFVAALAAEEATLQADEPTPALREVRALQRDVLDHLDWVTQFAAAVGETDTDERLFAALSDFASAFVAWDAAQVDDRPT